VTDDYDDIEAEAQALVDAYPELDAEELKSTYTSVAEAWLEDERPSPYTEAERHAHRIVSTFLSHTGVKCFDGVQPEQSDLSRQSLVEAMGLDVAVNIDENTGQPVAVMPLAVIPVDTLVTLLTDYGVYLGLTHIRKPGEPHVPLLTHHLRYVARREVDDAALRWHRQHHPDDPLYTGVVPGWPDDSEGGPDDESEDGRDDDS
jgi:hypothetical protein